MDVHASPDELPEVKEFLGSFQVRFRRPEGAETLERYMTGLLTELPTKNCDTITRAVPETSEQRLQEFLYLLATGDKTSLRALVLAPVCLPIAQRIRGHVICLEQIVKRVIQRFGFRYVKNKIVPARACDTALSAVFGSGWDATESNVLAALDSYINELRSLPIDLLTYVDRLSRG